MKRYGWVISLRPEKVEEYRRLHAEVWPEVLRTITARGIRKYSIFLREPELLLFGCFEYHGADFDKDMKMMAADPVTRDWWALTDPCQSPLPTVATDEKWAPMEEVFYHE